MSVTCYALQQPFPEKRSKLTPLKAQRDLAGFIKWKMIHKEIFVVWDGMKLGSIPNENGNRKNIPKSQ